MNLRIVGSLVRKDLFLYFQNRFIAVITLIGLAFYILVFFLMPESVNESVEIALNAPIVPAFFGQFEEKGLRLRKTSNLEELEALVSTGEVSAGIAVGSRNGKPVLSLYFPSDIPAEFRDSIEVMAKEFSYALAGESSPLEIDEIVLGADLMGDQIAPRDRLRPLLAVLIIVMETLGLASLISEEIERRTLVALDVTPMRIGDFYLSKGITGFILAFTQVLLFMLIVGGLGLAPILILVVLVLGAVMSIGMGFLVGAIGRDFVSVLYIGILIMVPLMVPTFGVLFPGSLSGWVKAIPSYYLIDAMNRVASYGSGWSDVWKNLVILAGFDVVLVAAGICALRRKVS